MSSFSEIVAGREAHAAREAAWVIGNLSGAVSSAVAFDSAGTPWPLDHAGVTARLINSADEVEVTVTLDEHTAVLCNYGFKNANRGNVNSFGLSMEWDKLGGRYQPNILKVEEKHGTTDFLKLSKLGSVELSEGLRMAVTLAGQFMSERRPELLTLELERYGDLFPRLREIERELGGWHHELGDWRPLVPSSAEREL